MLDELKRKLVAILTSDPALGALLASESAVYYARPPKPTELPCLTLFPDERPDIESSDHGKFIVECHLDIWSTSAERNDAILAALDNLLFDGHRSAAMDTESFRVGSCRRLWSRVVESAMREMNGLEVEKRETLWRIILLKKAS